MSSEEMLPKSEYVHWLGELKNRFTRLQLKAAVAVNTVLLQFYWELGQDIVDKQQNHAWGDGFLAQLSQDLRKEFPDMKGFSKRNDVQNTLSYGWCRSVLTHQIEAELSGELKSHFAGVQLTYLLGRYGVNK